MSIKDNFKSADHLFEKKFFLSIFLLAISFGFFFTIDKLFSQIPDVRKLFIDNSTWFFGFAITVFLISVISLGIYTRSLDYYEAETNKTPKAAMLNVIIWLFFWVSWSIFCSWLTLHFQPLTKPVLITIFLLVSLPGAIAFLIAKRIRKKDIQQERFDAQKQGTNYEPYTICLERKYYSGYYGLICLPVYLVSACVIYLFN